MKCEPLLKFVDLITRGITPKYTNESGCAVLNQRCVRNERIILSEARKHDNVTKPVAKNKLLKKYDILVNSTGIGTLGRVAQNYNAGLYATVDSHVTIVRPNKDVNPVFLGYVLKWRQPGIEALAEGSTGQTELSRQRLGNEITVPVFSLGKQEQIAKILLSLDDKIELNNAINHNLQQQARAIYREWFVDFIPNDGIMPIDWKMGRLKDILRLKRNAIKVGDEPWLPYLPIDVIPMNSFALSEVRPNAEAQSSLITFDTDDIVIGAMRVYFHRVVLAPCRGITRTTCFVLAPYDSDYFAFGLLCCDQDTTIDYAQTTSKGSTMPYAVWDGGLGDMEIVIPPRAVAQKFNDIVKPMLRQIKASYFENFNLRNMRDALLPKLMNGEIDVSELVI